VLLGPELLVALPLHGNLTVKPLVMQIISKNMPRVHAYTIP
jgi:hypothetical protein